MCAHNFQGMLKVVYIVIIVKNFVKQTPIVI
jgi:hypothetical protein